MTDDWFEDLFGFTELRYEETRRQFEVVGTTLRSRVNGQSYGIGELETPSLGELRSRARTLAGTERGTLRVSAVAGDVGVMHRDPANRGALFQVASQFNLLEMTGPGVAPEQLSAIFEPFYRGESELTRKKQGTGIGLSLVRGLVERMRGHVEGKNLTPGFEVRVELPGASTG